MRAFLLLAVALVAVGCVGSPPEDKALMRGTEGPSEGAPVAAASGDAPASAAEAPTWALGDAWLITTSDGGGASSQSALVVTGVSADTYTVSTTSEELAGYDAMFDVSYVGPIRARDLAGAQDGRPIQYYDFPLADGKTWTTTWDGRDVALKASRTANGFDILGTVDGSPYVSYDLAPELKWFSHMDFAAGYGLRVDRFTPGWTGEVLKATANVIYEGSSAAPVLSPAAGSFVVDADQAFAMVTIEGGGDKWARGFGLVQPDGTPYMSTTIGNVEVSDAGAAQGGFRYQERLPPTEGEWRIGAPTAHDATGWAHVIVHEVAIEKLAVL
ncbi:MAG TPA: hypothetical protein VM370_10355 [Candidatus Thermoplasmatota archaeon]|nr:hypothetical protein [Candidatus Thermoplasmatota archaeon]